MNDDHSNWILTYSDMMSLLLCFFLMLYALSTMQQDKIAVAADSLRDGFGGLRLSGELKVAERNLKAGTKNRNGQYTYNHSQRAVSNCPLSFVPGKDELTDEAKMQLDIFVRQLILPVQLTIIGRCADDEPLPYRRKIDLAYSRSVAVWDELVTLGIQRDSITVQLENGGLCPPLVIVECRQ